MMWLGMQPGTNVLSNGAVDVLHVGQEEAVDVITLQWPRACWDPILRMPRAAGYHWKELVLAYIPSFEWGTVAHLLFPHNRLLVM